MKRKREYSNNVFNAHAKLLERHNKALKALIEARTDYESNIYSNFTELPTLSTTTLELLDIFVEALVSTIIAILSLFIL